MFGTIVKIVHLWLVGVVLIACLLTSLANGADPEAHMTVVRFRYLSPN